MADDKLHVDGRGRHPNSLKNLEKGREMEFTHEQRSEWARQAGIKSGEVRREKRRMQETIQQIFSMNVSNGEAQEFTSYNDAKDKNVTVEQALILAQIKKAMKGDTRAVEFLRDTAGQKPTDKMAVEGVMKVSPLQQVLDEIKGKGDDDLEDDD